MFEAINDLNLFHKLGKYLKSQMEIIGVQNKVIITISNNYPPGLDGPQVVFTGVGLTIGNLSDSNQMAIKRLQS